MRNCVIGELRVKIFATGCQILWLKCTKFDFGWGSAPDSAGELTAPPDPLAGYKGAYFSANLFTVDSPRVVPARYFFRGVIARTSYVLTYLLTSVVL